ncbi:hypothetical protein BDQ12DRAFT_681408 [Crucibulum laeve]|uniref:DUF6533 domain-containing protein n=1 Tax=Crucibulum laeve TaxID=68775 RepID=A0A5C3M5G8_9AGAR|nr:hypothetical protein BDQ12DRAFT_681408 [Crucibulum laeve]
MIFSGSFLTIMATIEDVVRFLSDIRLIKLCQSVATALTLYDHVLTVSDEVEYIWKKKWSLPTLLYFITRYSADLLLVLTMAAFFNPQISQNSCFIFIRFQGWSSSLLYFSMQGILLIKLMALYNEDERTKRFLIFAYVLQLLLASGVNLYGNILYFQADIEPFPGIHHCTPTGVPPWFPVWWLPMILFDATLFVFALRIGIKHQREVQPLRRDSIIEIIVRDSILYYLAVLSINGVNALMWLALKGLTYEIPQGFSIAAVCVLGCRMVINLRKASKDSKMGGSELQEFDVNGLVNTVPDRASDESEVISQATTTTTRSSKEIFSNLV